MVLGSKPEFPADKLFVSAVGLMCVKSDVGGQTTLAGVMRKFEEGVPAQTTVQNYEVRAKYPSCGDIQSSKFTFYNEDTAMRALGGRPEGDEEKKTILAQPVSQKAGNDL
ncbi:hypothetical protein AVEN_29831-1 [Araneus ventricosus]|uniref:Uncharacterized protein n=1 Tax=Araneus ventricosus TaxID=182803 RepID=A0A4Y2J9V1_ARAVE|nr:hypothetical protein AVEN_29831-1 [Araneus ventricosus]